MKFSLDPLQALRRMARKGFRGYPVGTVAAYGPDDQRATKLAVGVVLKQDAEPHILHRWISNVGDVRLDRAILAEVVALLNQNKIKSLAMTEVIIGCPHEEGVDYPEGTACPQCSFWKDRDRWSAITGPLN